MTNVMKDVLMDLMFGSKFPASCRIQSEDPDCLDTIAEMDDLIHKMKKKFPKEECSLVADILALNEIVEGYQKLECYHSGLVDGFELRDAVRGDLREDIVTYLIR